MRTALTSLIITALLAAPAAAQDDDGFFGRLGDAIVQDADFDIVIDVDDRGVDVRGDAEVADGRIGVRYDRSYGINATLRVVFRGDARCREFIADSDSGYIGRLDRSGEAMKHFARFNRRDRVEVSLVCIDEESSLEGLRSDEKRVRLQTNEVTTIEFDDRDFD